MQYRIRPRGISTLTFENTDSDTALLVMVLLKLYKEVKCEDLKRDIQLFVKTYYMPKNVVPFPTYVLCSECGGYIKIGEDTYLVSNHKYRHSECPIEE